MVRSWGCATSLPYHPLQRAGLFLGGLLERNGFYAQGRPPAVPPAAHRSGAVRTVVRKAARRGATSLYRVGYQKMAPTLRKWGAV